VAGVLRGELYWADLDPAQGHEQGGLRPVLVLSHAVFNERSGTVIAVAITSSPQRAGFPLTVPVPSGLLPKESWIKVSQIRTISTQRLRGRIGDVPPELLATVLEGLEEILGA
jgi:mRNA interferase MazF